MGNLLAINVAPAARVFLANRGFMLQHESACSKDKLREIASRQEHDLIVFGQESRLGPSAVLQLREHQIPTPAIQILKGPRDRDWSRRCVAFLDCGGDAVIAGPPQVEEIAYSVSAVLRRSLLAKDDVYRFQLGDISLIIETLRARVLVNGLIVNLTADQYLYLLALAQHSGPISRDELAEKVDRYYGATNTLEVQICKTRAQLGAARKLIVTHRSRGYELIGRQP